MLVRIEFAKLLIKSGLEARIIMTVHDSIVVDCPTVNVSKVIELLQKAVDSVPEICYNKWNWKFTLPFTAEYKVGMSMGTLEKYKH
jgi:hypothetical protein